MLSNILRFFKKIFVAAAVWFAVLLVILFTGEALGLADAGGGLSAAYSISAVLVPVAVAVLAVLPKRKNEPPVAEVSEANSSGSSAQVPMSDTPDPTPEKEPEFVFLPLPEVPSRHRLVTNDTRPSHTGSAYVAPFLPPVSQPLFPKKLRDKDLAYIHGRLNQLKDTINLVNSTVKPDIFFKRLNFALDILLDLREYEQFGVFKPNSPTSDYNEIIRNMESIVDAFLDRAVADNQLKVNALKTEAARVRNREKFLTHLSSAFEQANEFWTGNKGYPHYSGPLYTKKNLERVYNLSQKLEP